MTSEAPATTLTRSTKGTRPFPSISQPVYRRAMHPQGPKMWRPSGDDASLRVKGPTDGRAVTNRIRGPEEDLGAELTYVLLRDGVSPALVVRRCGFGLAKPLMSNIVRAMRSAKGTFFFWIPPAGLACYSRASIPGHSTRRRVTWPRILFLSPN
jgi:hypothetical protein